MDIKPALPIFCLDFGPPARRLTLAIAVAATLGLGGCTNLGPNFSSEETETSAQINKDWQERDERLDQTETESKEWWKVFNDASLNKLIDMAYAQNLELQVAGLRVLQARAVLGIAVGNQYPQNQIGAGSVSRAWPSTNVNPTKNLSSEQRNKANNPTNTYDAGFNASWEADFWGKFRRGIESADATLLASMANYDDVLVILIGDVASTYVQIRTLQERLKVATDNIKAQRRSLRIANVRFDNGATTELDVQQARALLATTQSTVPALERGIRQNENALSILLGQPPGGIAELMGEGKIPEAPETVAIGIPGELLRRRPDVRVAELAAASQSALIGATEANLYPSFGISGSIGVTTSAFSRWVESDSVNGIGSIGFNWAILNYGRIKNSVRIQDALYQEALTNYRNSVLSAAREVEDGLVGFINTGREAEFLKKAVRASSRSVQLSLIQYRDGATDYQRVINSQQDLLARQDQYVSARGAMIGSLVVTYRALGGGWQLRDGNDFVPEATLRTMGERTDWGTLLEPASLDKEQRNKVSW
jgi:NodT family efflux transporter outer membrane factor (OMF) lipoprotein